MRPPPVLIVKTGTTLPELCERRGDYDDWIAAGLGLPRSRIDVARVDEGEPLPEARGLAGIVVTGSSAMVSERADWSERTAAWLAGAVEAETPILGICYGHQLLAHALGGAVGVNPRGREIGTVEAGLRPEARDDPLLGVFSGSFAVQATHVESVLALPAGARLLASSAGDPHFAFSVGAAAWGVQFHPEFDADIVRAYLVARREVIREEGLDPDALLAAAFDSPDGSAVLGRFAELLA